METTSESSENAPGCSRGEGAYSRCLLLNAGSRFGASRDVLGLGTMICCLCERGGSLVPTGYLLLDHLSAQRRAVKTSFGSAQEKQTNPEPPSFSFPPTRRHPFVTLALFTFLTIWFVISLMLVWCCWEKKHLSTKKCKWIAEKKVEHTRTHGHSLSGKE